MTAHAEPEVLEIAIRVCRPCLDGAGGQCHTPGCALWLHDMDTLPIARELYEVVERDPATGDVVAMHHAWEETAA